MVTQEQLDQYELTVGIECHTQFKTKTKIFSGASNEANDAAPNTTVSPICFGLPGVLPVLNEKVVEYGIRAGIALNAEIARFSTFDRKHYFYPDLPKGYQITQFEQPIVGRGSVVVSVNGESHTIGITRAHLEEDAGKLIHPEGKDYSLVDLNRAGTPLLEIVSEPDIHSPAVARAYAQELYYLMKYADVTEGDLYQGNMRFDVNLSVAKKGSAELGTRSETKNLNSFRAVEKVVEYEFRRQVELLESGQSVEQETRGWNDAKMKTFSQRSKADAHDYRYFPEPDLPPLTITEDEIEAVRSAMPLLPTQIRERLRAAGVRDETVETLIGHPELIHLLLDELKDQPSDAVTKRIADWFANTVVRLIDGTGSELKFVPGSLIALANLVNDGTISATAAKQLLEAHYQDFSDPKALAESAGLLQESDEDALREIVKQVINDNPQAASDVRSGEMKAIGFLVGAVMKASKGAANPPAVQKLLKEELGV